jgi:hypothetical protein
MLKQSVTLRSKTNKPNKQTKQTNKQTNQTNKQTKQTNKQTNKQPLHPLFFTLYSQKLTKTY